MMQDNVELFDNFDRKHIEPSKYSEPQWEYLNRAARPGYQYIRELLQEWFNDFEATPDKRGRLWADFRSDKDAEHLSAFFELYLHQLFKKQGFEIDIEPEWEQGRPDFILTSPRGEKILLEAAGIYPERWFGSAKKLEHMVIDDLNDNLVSPDFFLHINIENAPNDYPPYGRIRRYLQGQLAQLNYDQVVNDAIGREGLGLKRFPSITWKHDSWTIEFIAIPKKDLARGKPGVCPIGSISYGFEYVDTASSIKSRIDNKYGKYGELNLSFIIAINNVDAYADEDSMLDALFGQEVVHVSADSNETSVSRQPNGAWFGPNGYQKKRVSGICYFRRLHPTSMHLVSPVVWHHPYANIPLEPELLGLAQQIPNHITRIYESREGKHPCELLAIDQTKMPE